VGRVPRRRGQAEGRAGEGLELAAHQRRVAHPAGEGQRPVPELRPGEDRGHEGRLRGGHPPRRPRPRLRGHGENIYVVRDGAILTPPQTASILDGINRRSIIQIARDLGFTVVERDLARAELYLADEVFVSGTAAELVPVREIDDHAIGTGEPGEITRAVQQAFEDALHGRTERYREWLDPVPAFATRST
jgi:hypothetical protein